MRLKRNAHTKIVTTVRQNRMDRVLHSKVEMMNEGEQEVRETKLATEEELVGFQSEKDFIRAKKKGDLH